MTEETGLARADRLAAEGRYDALVGQLIELLEVEADPALRVALYERAVQALAGPLAAPDNALLVLNQAFQEIPDDARFGPQFEALSAALGRWHEALAAYEGACEAHAGPTALPLHQRLAAWYTAQDEPADALRHRLVIRELDPTDAANEDALIEALEGMGEWAVVAELWQGRLAASEAPADRAAARQRLIELHEGRLNDAAGALALAVDGFAEDPDDGQGRELARLATRAGDWAPLFEAYERACDHRADDPAAAEPFHARLAEWYDLEGREADALTHRVWLAEQHPDDPAQQRTLARWLEQAGEWRKLVDLLTRQLDNAADQGARVRAALRIAQILEEHLDGGDEAFDLLGRVFVDTLDGGLEMHLETLAERQGAFKPLARLYRRALDRTFADPSEAATLHLKAALIYDHHLRDGRRAADQYAHVLTYEPGNERALAGVARLLEQEGRVEELAAIRWREAESPADAETRFARWLAVGDLYREQLKDPVKAVEAWFKALQVRPDTRQVLTRLLDVYGETDRWEASIKVLRKLAKLETDPEKQARFIYAIGIIQRDKIEDHYVAVRTLDQALEVDPTLVRAFQAIDEILTVDQDYARQDRYYRKMLVRARQHHLDDALVVSLARNLGEINRSRLHNYAEAIKAYQIVAHKRPGDRGVHTILAELHALEGQPGEAAAQAFELVTLDPADPSGYHELARRRLDAGQLDGAWCACQVLVVLGQATEDEQRFYEEGRRHSTAQAQRPLEGGDWALLTWAGKPQAIDRVLLATHEVVGPLMAHTPKQLGLNPRKDQLNLEAPSDLGQILKYTQQITGVTVASAWLSPTARGLQVGDLWPPGLLVAPDMAGVGFAEAAARAARALYLGSVQHAAAGSAPDATVAHQRVLGIVTAALAAVMPEAGLAADPALLDALRSRLTAGRLADLQGAAPAIPQPLAQGVAAWCEAVEHTASRLALLISCDLATVVRLLRDEPMPLLPDMAARLRALLVFAVSEPYLALRRRLGVGVPERS